MCHTVSDDAKRPWDRGLTWLICTEEEGGMAFLSAVAQRLSAAIQSPPAPLQPPLLTGKY